MVGFSTVTSVGVALLWEARVMPFLEIRVTDSSPKHAAVPSFEKRPASAFPRVATMASCSWLNMMLCLADEFHEKPSVTTLKPCKPLAASSESLVRMSFAGIPITSVVSGSLT